MAIKVSCPGCQNSSDAPDDFAGKRVRCRKCGAAVDVPGVVSVAVDPEVPQSKVPAWIERFAIGFVSLTVGVVIGAIVLQKTPPVAPRAKPQVAVAPKILPLPIPVTEKKQVVAVPLKTKDPDEISQTTLDHMMNPCYLASLASGESEKDITDGCIAVSLRLRDRGFPVPAPTIATIVLECGRNFDKSKHPNRPFGLKNCLEFIERSLVADESVGKTMSTMVGIYGLPLP